MEGKDKPCQLGAADCLASPRPCQARGVFLGSPTADTLVSEPPSNKSARGAPAPYADKRSFFERLIEFISPGPDSKDELMKTLAAAEQRELIQPESRLMLEGVLRMAELSAGDVMVAAPRMDMLDIDADYDALLGAVIEAGHSRFPVYEDGRENVIGILLAKDLLKLQRAPELNLRTLLRPAVFVPESKALNELLRDFRSNRNHLAIVIDEFGNTAGLVTIEDVLEEIVGEIEDEFDARDEAREDTGIYTLADGTQRVAGDVEIDAVNRAFAVDLPTADFDTIGGLVAHEFGRVPRRGESLDIGGLCFSVMLTRGGAVRWFRVWRQGTNGEPRA
ncbi:magnesium/cobalt efflux protein [Rubrivivax gelatinosus]|nr:magnesium/cobalt efflux protein [Rubrivivax gelatinosus]